MSAPNPEFAARLLNAKLLSDQSKMLESDIPNIASIIANDLIIIQGDRRYKSYETVAAMVIRSTLLREKFSSRELGEYDRIVAVAREHWFTYCNPPKNGHKIMNCILRVSPL